MLNIKEQLNNNPHTKLLDIISELSHEINIPSYLVGGYVRDIIIERDTKDIDIMVEGDGILFAKELSKRLKINEKSVKNSKHTPSLLTEEVLVAKMMISAVITCMPRYLHGIAKMMIFA